MFSLPCLGYYRWLRAVTLLRLRVLRDSFAPPRLSAASKADHCPDRQCAATWAGCSAAATCRLPLRRGCRRRIVPGGREAVPRTQYPTPPCRCCGTAPSVGEWRLARLRAGGVAREDEADRRPPLWFRLLRRVPQRGRACHAILTYAWRPRRLRVGRLGRAARRPKPLRSRVAHYRDQATRACTAMSCSFQNRTGVVFKTGLSR